MNLIITLLHRIPLFFLRNCEYSLVKHKYSRLAFLFRRWRSLSGSLFLGCSVFFITLLHKQGLHFKNERNLIISDSAGFRDTYTSNCVVIIRKCRGRLGNKMFLFASAYGIARFHGCALYVDRKLWSLLIKTFRIHLTNTISENAVAKLENVTKIETVCLFFPDLMRLGAVRYLELGGYWQSYRHFIEYGNELKYHFTFRKELLFTTMKFLRYVHRIKHFCDDSHSSFWCSGIVSQNVISQYTLKSKLISIQRTWIGVHVRRQDMLEQKVESSVWYIRAAMIYFRQKYPSPVFLMASDDKSYCYEFFGNLSDVIITPNEFSPSEDLTVLSLCQHTVVTAGTFGWWAGFLAGGQVLHDNKYPHGDIRNDTQCTKQNYYLPSFLIFHNQSTFSKYQT